MVKPGLKDPAGWNGGIKRLVGLGLTMFMTNLRLLVICLYIDELDVSDKSGAV